MNTLEAAEPTSCRFPLDPASWDTLNRRWQYYRQERCSTSTLMRILVVDFMIDQLELDPTQPIETLLTRTDQAFSPGIVSPSAALEHADRCVDAVATIMTLMEYKPQINPQTQSITMQPPTDEAAEHTSVQLEQIAA